MDILSQEFMNWLINEMNGKLGILIGKKLCITII